jgi:hypothetical protein
MNPDSIAAIAPPIESIFSISSRAARSMSRVSA